MDAIEKINMKLKKQTELFNVLREDGYEYCRDVRGIPVFRKRIFRENGTFFGKWKAIDDNMNIIDITYEQALGWEAIRLIDKLAMFLGSKLLPH